MKKSTHRGHCQACGHLQMLPKGLLSKHGYNVTHGYFSGTCAGAGELPFEQSCELVKQFIASATDAKTKLEQTIAELKYGTLTAETKMWYHVYVPSELHWSGRSGYAWQLVELSASFKPFSGETNEGYFVYSFVDSFGRKHGDSSGGFHGVQRFDKDGGSTDVEACRLATVRRYNKKRAEWLSHEVTSLTRYIAWQTERVQNWAPAELLPVDAKDKLGFVPTKAPY